MAKVSEMMQKELVDAMARSNDESQKVRQLQDQIARQVKELNEYYRVQEVLIAAGYVTKDKIDQAHDIVRGLPG